jgi:hypothetical protein
MGNEEDRMEQEWQIIRLRKHYQRAIGLKVRLEAVLTLRDSSYCHLEKN